MRAAALQATKPPPSSPNLPAGQRCHRTKYPSKNYIVLGDKMALDKLANYFSVIRKHPLQINIKLKGEKKGRTLYYFDSATKVSLRTADGLKKRCKEIAGQGTSCQCENHIVKIFPIAWEKHWHCLEERPNL